MKHKKIKTAIKMTKPVSITNKIEKAVKDKTPLSMVRLGDGEFTIIRYPLSAMEKECRARIHRWFDASQLSTKQIRVIRNQIHSACVDANILGVPSLRERIKMNKWRGFEPICKNLGILTKGKVYYHFYKVQAIDYQRILQHVDEVTCITCRNIPLQMQKHFNLQSVRMITIPPETFLFNKKMKRHNKNVTGKKHYPNMYTKIIKHLQSEDLTGRVFLIGAGGLGKSYCMHVKKAGGIALDIGALFDGWAGLYTRPFLKKPIRYKLK